MSLTDKVEISRRTMTLFFVIDASDSMAGERIGAVNAAIDEVIPALREIEDENPDAQIKVAVLAFSSGARWLTPNGPVEVDQFSWDHVDATGSSTDLGAACNALNEKLSTRAFMGEVAGSYAPVIFLVSGSGPTDDWQNALETLKQNKWFTVSKKVAVAIGDDANKEVLKAFTGRMEAVSEAHGAAMLKEVIESGSLRALRAPCYY